MSYTRRAMPHLRVWKATKWGGLALSALFVTIWVASYAYSFGRTDLETYDAFVVRGWVHIERRVFLGYRSCPPHGWFVVRGSFEMKPAWTWDVQDSRSVVVELPLWFIVAPLWMPVAAGAALAWRADVRALARGSRGRCVGCGYDLSGTVGAFRCPECGTAGCGEEANDKRN